MYSPFVHQNRFPPYLANWQASHRRPVTGPCFHPASAMPSPVCLLSSRPPLQYTPPRLPDVESSASIYPSLRSGRRFQQSRPRTGPSDCARRSASRRGRRRRGRRPATSKQVVVAMSLVPIRSPNRAKAIRASPQRGEIRAVFPTPPHS